LKTFEELGVNEEIRRAIVEMGYENPMPVQEEVIPYLLGNGNDVIALAQTGTGKTAAYGLPLLQKVDASRRETQAIILCPTRELCLQISDDLNDYSKYIDGMHVLPVYGGASIETQIHALRHGVQIIVATPGRLIDLMHRGETKLGAVNNVVLDEADEMLNMGFSESIDEILAGMPKYRNTLLFSATMSKEIEKIAQNYLHEYKEIVVGSRNEGAENVNHIYYMVNAKDKYLALKRIVDFNPRIYAIIFCRTKRDTQEIADKLIRDGYNAESLHGDLSQQQRDTTMQKFRQHITQLLVATDVAARGLDVEDLTHVINFGLPDDIESYTHRSGRTGRAGKKGTSIAIIHTREKNKMRAIEREIGKSFVQGEIPTPKEICTKQLYKVMDQIEKVDVNEEEIEQFLPEINRRFDYMEKEDLIKKVVSLEFGKFLAYYADAPEIEKPSDKGPRSEGRGDRSSRGDRGGDRGSRRGGSHKAEEGYKRLFINLGKADGFYPGRVMEFFNKNIEGKQEVGHIDLLQKFSYIEVPEKDAEKVMKAINGVEYEGRTVRCNDADEGGSEGGGSSERRSSGRGDRRSSSDRGGRSSDRGSRSSDRGGRSSDRGGRSSDRGGRGGYGSRRSDERSSRGGRRSSEGSFDKYEKKSKSRSESSDDSRRPSREERGYTKARGKKDDWKQFFNGGNNELKGEEPDFSEEGWARRKPKK
jgi:ATP-dependent RNA helicase DeaD